MDTHLLNRVTHQPPRVLILPTAAVRGNPQMAANNGIRHFRGLGADASALMITDRAGADDPQNMSALDHVDVVYLAGGDPWYLLDVLRDSLLYSALLAFQQRGGIISGSSAGAMVLAEMMRTSDFTGWINALGIVKGIAVLPHHEHLDQRSLKSLQRQLAADLAIVGIDEGTACISRADKPQIWEISGIGNVTLYRQGSVRRFQPGEEMQC